jgi:CRISPR system Cascade subunit CasD
MSTLLLRFAAPLQAWGSASRFNNRTTEREPTKSGVIGFVAAAMGRRRTDRIDDLLALRFGVRIDQRGKLLRDFHTAHTFDNKQAFVSNRYYLSDAIFVIGLESENDELLQTIEEAVRHPVFPLFLGRRSCPPSGQIILGIRQGIGLIDALKDMEHTEWQAKEWYQKKQPDVVHLEIVTDSDAATGNKKAFMRRDLPDSFDQKNRSYGFRNVISDPKAILVDNPIGTKYHDPMEVL